jgi:phosphatidylserine/phosphatidylglycerophosphate/cardiolipin synthase-like enzyme
MSDIWKVIAELGIEMHPDQIVAFATKIASMNSPADIEKGRAIFGPGTDSSLVDRLAKTWEDMPSLSPAELAAALRSASHTASIVSGSENVQLVWSGPDTKLVPIRRTEQVLIEVIQAANTRLFLISFVAYAVSSVMDSMRKAAERGLNISILLESSESHGGKISVDSVAKMRKALPDATVYVWRPELRGRDERGRFGAVHAKCAVADGKVAFVTSANLTDAALEKNMEIGVLIKGGSIPNQLDRHLEALVTTRTIVEA